MSVELWCDGSEKKTKKKRNYIVMSIIAYLESLSNLVVLTSRVRELKYMQNYCQNSYDLIGIISS